jgi:hypothetical protein
MPFLLWIETINCSGELSPLRCLAHTSLFTSVFVVLGPAPLGAEPKPEPLGTDVDMGCDNV